jgi:acyl-ACP thioesterase
MFEMVDRPQLGRMFAGSRRVRLGDCSPGGRLRLDATARYLQDLSDDDTRDAGLAQMTWVVRRTVIDVHEFPTYLEAVDMVTWCSAIGSRWAERRVDIGAGSGPSISSATLWVHLDATTLRPVPTTPEFEHVFAQTAAGRTVSSRLSLEPPPADLEFSPWPVRFTDFDVMNHMNNAIGFALVEEVLARRRDLRAPLRVEVEYRSPIDRDVTLSVGGVDLVDAGGSVGAVGADRRARGTGHDGWLVDDQARCQIAYRIRRLPDPPVRPPPRP